MSLEEDVKVTGTEIYVDNVKLLPVGDKDHTPNDGGDAFEKPKKVLSVQTRQKMRNAATPVYNELVKFLPEVFPPALVRRAGVEKGLVQRTEKKIPSIMSNLR